MFNARLSNVSVADRPDLDSLIRSLPVELREQVLGHYLRGIHARSNARRSGRLIHRRRVYSRGAVNYSRVRVRRLGVRR